MRRAVDCEVVEPKKNYTIHNLSPLKIEGNLECVGDFRLEASGLGPDKMVATPLLAIEGYEGFLSPFKSYPTRHRTCMTFGEGPCYPLCR